jgi:hypothetical protein
VLPPIVIAVRRGLILDSGVDFSIARLDYAGIPVTCANPEVLAPVPPALAAHLVLPQSMKQLLAAVNRAPSPGRSRSDDSAIALLRANALGTLRRLPKVRGCVKSRPQLASRMQLGSRRLPSSRLPAARLVLQPWY